MPWIPADAAPSGEGGDSRRAASWDRIFPAFAAEKGHVPL